MRTSVFATRGEQLAAWIRDNGQLVTGLALICAILLAIGSGVAWRRANARGRAAELARGQYIRLALEAQRQLDSVAAGGWVKLGPNDVVIRRGTIQ